MTGKTAQVGEETALHRMERRIVELLRQAPKSPVPFFGDSQEFRDLAGSRLVIEIDPEQVRDQLPGVKVINGHTVRFADHFLGRGDWTPHLVELERSTVYREVAGLLANGFDYRAAPIYAELLARITRGKPPERNLVTLDSVRKLDFYFDELVALIRSIATSGYRRRPRYNGLASAEEAMAASSEIRLVALELMESEVGVAVGADGSLHRIGSGTHRLSIARLLKLPRIPVECRMFHVKWLRPLIKGSSSPMKALFSGIAELALPPADGRTKPLQFNPSRSGIQGASLQGETT